MSAALEYAERAWWLARGLEGDLRRVVVPERFYAWTSVGADAAAQLVSGGDLARGLGVTSCGEARPSLTDAVRLVGLDRSRVWLVPDPMARPGDPLLKTVADYIVAGDGVYHVASDSQPDQILTAWRNASSAAGQLGVVTSRPPVSLDPADLQAVAEHARLVVMSAFDGQGLLFFERRPPGDAHSEDLTELLWFGYRSELHFDYVSLSELERYVGRKTAEDGAQRMEQTLALIKFALDSGDAQAGTHPDGKNGLQTVWHEPSDTIVARARAEWNRLTRPPLPGEILWLQAASRGTPSRG